MVSFPPAGELKLSIKPFSKGLQVLRAEPWVAIRRWRNLFLIFAFAKIN